jgi:uncharacterized protein YndB with AHSA1/START domain
MRSDEFGTFARRDQHLEVRFERHYPRPVDTVWRALTDPARLADWMGVSEIEPFVGGRMAMMLDGPHPITGEVRVWDPPRVFEFSWSNTHAPDSVVRYELAPHADGTRLVFTHMGMPHANSALMLPGWHNFFDRLGSALAGVAPDGRSWRELQGIYVAQYDLRDVTLEP